MPPSYSTPPLTVFAPRRSQAASVTVMSPLT